MFVFWQRGYAGTSISDLVEATGLGRQSLYNTFGDKQELFGRTLRLYRQRTAELAAPLLRPDAGLSQLREFIRSAVADQNSADCGACMIVKTMFDRQVDDREIQEVVQAGAEGTRRLFSQVIRQAQRAGEVDSARDPDTAANYLFSVHNGLSALSRAGADSKELEGTLDFALDSLRPASAGRQ